MCRQVDTPRLWKEAELLPGLLHSEFTGVTWPQDGQRWHREAFGNLGGPARGHVLLFREQHSPGGGGWGSVLGMREVPESSEAGLSKELVKRSLVGGGGGWTRCCRCRQTFLAVLAPGNGNVCKDRGGDDGTFCEVGAGAGGQAEIRLQAPGDQGGHAGEERA